MPGTVYQTENVDSDRRTAREKRVLRLTNILQGIRTSVPINEDRLRFLQDLTTDAIDDLRAVATNDELPLASTGNKPQPEPEQAPKRFYVHFPTGNLSHITPYDNGKVSTATLCGLDVSLWDQYRTSWPSNAICKTCAKEAGLT